METEPLMTVDEIQVLMEKYRLEPEPRTAENPPCDDQENSNQQEATTGSRRRTGSVISNIFFFASLIMLVFAAFVYGAKGNVRYIGPYTCFTVLTDSMQSEIPQGAFLLVKRVDPGSIRVGDDITYMIDQKQSVTHRVIQINENYADSGMRGFTTKGIENPTPDSEVVYAENVVGVVQVSIPGLGDALTYIGENFWMVLGLLTILFAFVFCLYRLFGNRLSNRQHKRKDKQLQIG